MSLSKYKFFREQEESHNFTVDDVNGDSFFIPRSREKLNTTIIQDSEYDDRELTYKVSDSSKITFTNSRLDLPQFFIDKRIQVKKTEKMGLGCFALESIPEKTLIESSPVILTHIDTFTTLNVTNGSIHKLSEYPFDWGSAGMCALSLGYGGIYNHNINPNVMWKPSHEYESIQYTTIRNISEGEELFIRYLPLNKLEKLWFYDSESANYADQNKHEPKKDLESFFNLRFK